MLRQTKRMIAALIVGGIIVVGGVYWRYIDKIVVNNRTPKFTISTETTHITAPLDTHGYVDYETAVNQILSKDLKPEDNAAVYLMKAIGPKLEGAEVNPRFLQSLGIPKPVASPNDYVTSYRFIKQLKDSNQTPDPDFESQQYPLTKRPWKAKDHPQCADWLKQNEVAFTFVVQASRCSRYYHPILIKIRDLPGYEGRGSLVSSLLPLAQSCRELGQALVYRSMLHMGEGKHQEAWADLLAAHRLSRLVSNNASAIEFLVGLAIEAQVLQAEMTYLQTAKLSSDAIRAMTKDLDQLPPRQSATHCARKFERFMQLDVIQNMYRFAFTDDTPASQNQVSIQKTRAYLALVESYDWDGMLRLANSIVDRFCEACDKPNRQERNAAFDQLSAEIDLAINTLPSHVQTTVMEHVTGTVTKGRAERLVYSFLKLTIPSLMGIINSEDTQNQRYQNFRVACALAMYKADHGKYPATLTELHPKYLTPIPMDLFSGKPLIYQPVEGGYVLYSVGANGIDDDGQPIDGDPKGDDIVLRVPLPPLNN